MTTTHATTNNETDAADANQVRTEVQASLVAGTATQVSVRARQHRFTIDEPAELGGTDVGPNPVEALLAALGACQVITFQVWADKLGLTFDTLEIDLAGDLDLRGFFGLDEDVRPGFKDIDVRVRLHGSEPAERYAELVEVVERHCPVLDNLSNPVPVRAAFTAA